MGPRRVIVTGAAGFVASATIRRLLASGHRVLAWVRPESDLARLPGARSNPALEMFALDLAALGVATDRARAVDALRAFRPDAVLHAAWRGVRSATRDDPSQVDNIPLVLDALRACADAGARRWVGLGSQAEYGPQADVIREDTPARPGTLYGVTKLACGQLSLALARRLGLSAAWARIFSVYGPGEASGTLVPDLARALAAGQPFPLGVGSQRWDLLHEDDAASALEALLVTDTAQGTFNVASGVALPLRDIFGIVRDSAAPGTALALGTRPSSEGELPRLEADVRRLAEATGWSPRVPLRDGLTRTVAAVLGPDRFPRAGGT